MTAPTAASLRRSIHNHLVEIGFSKNGKGYFVDGEISKQRIRDVHAAHRGDSLLQNKTFIEEHGTELEQYIASGRTLAPEGIDPELVEVFPGSMEARLFRFATLLWSVPVSQGFGRRLRFLVRDRQNGCVIGAFAMGDPVFNLSARDNWVDWTHLDRAARLVHVMDAYVVGAVPPYSHLIGGKLVAALMTSKEVRDAYERKYLGKKAIISKQKNRCRLVLLTTTSALGRSSIYNRLVIPNGARFLRIGTTKGYGHFHLSGEMFDLLRDHLASIEHPYATGNRFGMGPNWKIRVVRAALEDLGINANAMLKHGIEREVYAIPLAKNYRQVLQGEHTNVQSIALPAAEITDYCLRRWIWPRAERDKRYRRFARSHVLNALRNGGPGPEW